MAIGQPDWFRGVAPSRAAPATNQTRFIATAGASVPAGGAAVATLTAGADERLTLQVFIPSCVASLIQRFRWVQNSITVGTVDFDVSTVVALGDNGAFVLPPGTSLALRLENNDTVAREMLITIFGMSEEVA